MDSGDRRSGCPLEKGESSDPPKQWDWRGPTKDWRTVHGVIGECFDQGKYATCWACSVIYSIQALYNISREPSQQIQLSVQHLVNNVSFDPRSGITNIKKAFDYARIDGICSAHSCKQHGGGIKAKECQHSDNVLFYRIDDYKPISDVDDVILLEHVERQPVVVVMRLTDNFFKYGKDSPRIFEEDPDDKGTALHLVLVVGFGSDKNGKPYWIIMNSWGVENGFGYVYRQTKPTYTSIFKAAYYPTI